MQKALLHCSLFYSSFQWLGSDLYSPDYDKKTGKKSRRPPQFAKKGQKVIALLETAAPICVERSAFLFIAIISNAAKWLDAITSFADHPQLGRFTLRDEGKTIGIGKVSRLPSSWL